MICLTGVSIGPYITPSTSASAKMDPFQGGGGEGQKGEEIGMHLFHYHPLFKTPLLDTPI